MAVRIRTTQEIEELIDVEDNLAVKYTSWLLPENMRKQLVNYVMRGIPLGGFLKAVVCNDLNRSYSTADPENKKKLGEWSGFVFWDLPKECRGSKDIYDSWVIKGGLEYIK